LDLDITLTLYSFQEAAWEYTLPILFFSIRQVLQWLDSNITFKTRKTQNRIISNRRVKGVGDFDYLMKCIYRNKKQKILEWADETGISNN
jgi:hypothetical protein